MNAKDREESLTLEILQTIDSQSDVTQRHLANRLGVALGLANAYLKRCVRKGLIKIEQAPANRYLYYLTPRGFAEKSRLTAEFLTVSFDFYRRASGSCTRVFQVCHQRQYQRVVLCGISELAEIASLRAMEQGINIIGIIESDADIPEFIGIPVYKNVTEAGNVDACVITAIKSPFDVFKRVQAEMVGERIFIPDLFDMSTGEETET